MTMPETGWTSVPDKAKFAESVVGQRSMRILRTNGMLAVKVPARPWVDYDSFQWLSSPPPADDQTLVWYIDGSAQNPKWEEIATFGFGIVVTSAYGDLVAWGFGIPPKWITSAADAEAWALSVALRQHLRQCLSPGLGR